MCPIPQSIRFLFCAALASLVYRESTALQLFTHHKGKQLFNVALAAGALDPLPCLQVTFPHSYYKVVEQQEIPCDDNNNTCAGFVAVSIRDKQMFVSFRGTNTNAQLLTETIQSLEAEVDWDGVGHVDKYFYNGMKVMWPMVERVLSQESTRHYKVVFTGHSLGGALAALTAMNAHVNGLRNSEQISLITYGQPRVGNRVFAASLMEAIPDTWRIVHNQDIVPHLPPCKDLGEGCDPNAFRRAYHHGTEVWYPNDMIGYKEFKVCTDNFEDPKCSNSIGSWNAHDHLRYYGVDVTTHAYVRNCQDPYPEKSSRPRREPSPSFTLSSMLLLHPIARLFAGS